MSHIAHPLTAVQRSVNARLLTDYQQGRALLEQPGWTAQPPHVVRSGQPGLGTAQALLAAGGHQLLFADEATHQRLRTALDGPLARLSARVTPFLRQTVQDLLAGAALRSEIDVETEVARPLAIRTLARLQGWPEEHLSIDRMAAWSAALADVTTGHRVTQALPVVQQMASAFRALVAVKLISPAEDLSSLVATSAAFHTETERVITLMVVFGAGTSTTISALVNGLPLLLADQERFPDPDRLDWHRPAQPEQAAFGFGSHACPGAPLARLELRVALEALVSMPSLALVAPPEGWSHNPNQRRAQRVRIRVS